MKRCNALHWLSCARLLSQGLTISTPETVVGAAADRAEVRVASPPWAALHTNGRLSPLKQTALLANPMNGMNPEPDAFWQSVQ